MVVPQAVLATDGVTRDVVNCADAHSEGGGTKFHCTLRGCSRIEKIRVHSARLSRENLVPGRQDPLGTEAGLHFPRPGTQAFPKRLPRHHLTQ